MNDSVFDMCMIQVRCPLRSYILLVLVVVGVGIRAEHRFPTRAHARPTHDWGYCKNDKYLFRYICSDLNHFCLNGKKRQGLEHWKL